VASYSYDRRTKIARRGLGDDIEGLNDTLGLAREGVKLATEYLRETSELFRVLEVSPLPDAIDDAKTFLETFSKVSRELPRLLAEADAFDDALDAYTRMARRKLTTPREDFTSDDVDPHMLADFTRRGEDIAEKLSDLEQLVTDAPSSFDIEDYTDSKRTERINEMASRMGEISSEGMFDTSFFSDFVSNVEEYIVRSISGND